MLKQKNLINCSGRLVSLDTPKVMGILNVTPDSFFDGGRYNTNILQQAEKLMNEQCDILDLGAYSSRPGAEDVSAEEEKERLNYALDVIRTAYPEAIISVDTFRSEVARFVVEKYNVDMINDIAAGDLDEEMFDVMADLQVPYIIMHMKGNPQNMQTKASYNDVVTEVIAYLSEKVDALKQKGVHDVIIDPGFGFGKTMAHNYSLMNRLKDFEVFELPVLVGISRKSMIYNLLGCNPQEALNGTTFLNTVALLNGAHILRVHDVKEAVECVKMYQELKK